MARMAQSEPREKRMFTWSVDMCKRFCNAVDALGGPLATPKKIKELMEVADVTEEDIESHMLLQNYRPAQVHNARSIVSRDVMKGKNVIQSGSQSLHIGESSNGQLAAAAAGGRGTSSSWAFVCRASDLLPSVREMLVQLGALEMPESSSSSK